MTDRELLEDAAKAAGIYYWIDADAVVTHSDTPGSTREWDPITDDGDALRLAVTLGLLGAPYMALEWIEAMGEDDPLAATRRAIVRAAAELGKGKA
jgi:hypothetical protein